jgi:hypothetical protein
MSEAEKKDISSICRHFNDRMVLEDNFLMAIMNAIIAGKKDNIGSLKTIEPQDFLKEFETEINNTIKNLTEKRIRDLSIFLLKNLCIKHIAPSLKNDEINSIIDDQIFKA